MKRKVWPLFLVMLFCLFLQYACSSDSGADETDVHPADAAVSDISDEANTPDLSIEDLEDVDVDADANTGEDVSDGGQEDIKDVSNDHPHYPPAI